MYRGRSDRYEEEYVSRSYLDVYVSLLSNVTEQAVSYACLRVHRTFANYYESRREAVVVARYAIITT